MSGAANGAWLGFANSAVIALGIAVSEHQGGVLFYPVLLVGAYIGVPAGAAIGRLAAARPHWSVPARLLALGLPAVAVVAVFGMALMLGRYILLACIPTLACVALLERWTRAGALLPVAKRVTAALR